MGSERKCILVSADSEIGRRIYEASGQDMADVIHAACAALSPGDLNQAAQAMQARMRTLFTEFSKNVLDASADAMEQVAVMAMSACAAIGTTQAICDFINLQLQIAMMEDEE